MFNRKRKNKVPRLDTQDASFGTVIGEGTVIHGNVHANGGLRVDGQIMGDIELQGNGEAVLAIGELGKVQGNIRGDRIIIGGTVLGNIEARDWVELRDGSRVSGDIHYETLSIEPGAVVAGQLLSQSGKTAEPITVKPAEKAGEKSGEKLLDKTAAENTPGKPASGVGAPGRES